MIFYPRKIIVLAYLVIPALLYGILFYLTLKIGEIKIHWYITLPINSASVLSIYSKFLVLGLPLAYMCPEEFITREKKSPILSIFSLVLFCLYSFVEFSYVRSLCFVFFIIIVSSSGISRKMLLLFICIGFLKVLMGGDRFIVIIPTLLLMITFDFSYRQYLTFGSLLVLILVFVLTPIKANLPIIDFIRLNGISYFWQHLQPIILSAIYFDSNQLEIGKSFVEMIPFGKSLFEYSGSINSARSLFAAEGFSGDFGSNSSGNVFVVCVIFACVIAVLLSIKDRRMRAALYLYFVCLAPYFIRRDFANFINDCFMILILAVFCLAIYLVLPKVRPALLQKPDP